MIAQLKTFGFEIEGEWKDFETISEIWGGEWKGDGSIHNCRDRADCAHLRLREYNSPVYQVDELGSIKRFFDNLQDRWDANNFHTNDSMGFHVHFGFDTKTPTEILSKEFIKSFQDYMRIKYSDMYSKRAGNRYCKTTIKKENVIGYDRLGSSMNWDRYHAVNTYHSLSRHGTVEIRLFDATMPDTMYKYLKDSIEFVKDFLLNGKLSNMQSLVIRENSLKGVTKKAQLKEIPIKRFNCIAQPLKRKENMHGNIEINLEKKIFSSNIRGIRHKYRNRIRPLTEQLLQTIMQSPILRTDDSLITQAMEYRYGNETTYTASLGNGNITIGNVTT